MPRLVTILTPADTLPRAEMYAAHAARNAETAADFRRLLAETGIPADGPVARHAARCARKALACQTAADRLGEHNMRMGG